MFCARYSKWGWLPSLVFSKVANWHFDVWAIGATRCDLLERDTRVLISFFHEETEHDGTAQSIVNEVMPRDWSGRPVVIPQRGSMPQQLIIGKGIKIILREVEWFSMDKTNDPQWMLQNTEKLLWYVEGSWLQQWNCSVQGKDNQLSFHREYRRLHT